MDYKYKRTQIFGKRLKIPKIILAKVYNCSLSFQEYIEYELDDKIPISCINFFDRPIVERFGIEKCKELDWEMIKKRASFRDILLEIDPKVENLNETFYELIKDKIAPHDYSKRMAESYPDRLFDINDDEYLEGIPDSKKIFIHGLKANFNTGRVHTIDIIANWELFKDKDISYCLLNDYTNSYKITSEELKDFMSKFGTFKRLIIENDRIYSFIRNYYNQNGEEERNEYIKKFAEKLIKEGVQITNDEYKEIFKYISLEEYILEKESYRGAALIKELNNLPPDYIFNTQIPFEVLLNVDVINFIGEYGLQNVVDFDNECGHIFTNNDCELLKLMYEMYMHYATNEYDSEKNIFKSLAKDEDGNYVKSTYTKDEFYEVIRRMIAYVPSKELYKEQMARYRDIIGEFRRRNPDLFLSDDAPEELQNYFYTKSITPKLIFEHPEYIEHLRDKNLESCFKERTIYVSSGEYLKKQNLYTYLSSIMNYDELMELLIEYNDSLDLIYDSEVNNHYQYEVKAENSDDKEKIIEKIDDSVRRLILENNISYPTHIPASMHKKYPTMFLPEDAPKELKEALYNRTITTDLILQNPEYLEFLRDVELESIFKYIPVEIDSGESFEYRVTTIVEAFKQTFGTYAALDVMILYGKYIEEIYKANHLNKYRYKENCSPDEFLDSLDDLIVKNIVAGKIKYDDKMASHFKKNNPTLFLDPDVPKEIRDKFYNREFTIQDFIENPQLTEYFDNTNIALAFPLDAYWVISLFENVGDVKTANSYRMKVINTYFSIVDGKFKDIFKDYIIKNKDKINIDKIDCIVEVLLRLEYSNSIELSLFKYNMASQLLETNNPIGNLNKVEKIFLKNNIPLCGKMFLCFQTLYPNMSKVSKFDFSSISRVAPELKDDSLPDVGFNVTNDEKRLTVIFNDLLRVAYRSNERSLLEYLNNLEQGNELYLRLKASDFNLNTLTDKEKAILEIFVSHLEVLYENTKNGKEEDLKLEDLSIEGKLKILSEKFKETERYDLKDRIVRSFCFTAGIKSFAELKQLVNDSLKEQERRTNRNLREIEENDGIFRIGEGDMIRGIGFLDSLSGSLNTGNFSKEHLGVFLGTSGSDTTPLDVDLTLVTNSSSIYNAVEGTPTGFGFGNIYLIIKKNNPNFYITRDKDGNSTGTEYNPKNVEIFGTKTPAGGYETHWGARTGISLADVDYILFKDRRQIDSTHPYDENGNVNYVGSLDENSRDELAAIKFEIAKNGYYIPVIDFSGKLLFTKEEFKQLRDKMQGLSYYHENTYELSEELINDEVLKIASTLTEEAKEETDNKRKQVNDIVKEVLNEMGLDIKYKLTGDLSSKSVEFIDTGSTGRDTNVPHDGDFDFYMRIDAEIIRDNTKFIKFKKKIEEKFREYDITECVITGNGDLRIKGVHLQDGNVVDVDISFGVKTNKVKYSSDECLKDRLSTIKKLYPDQYKYVVANIIMAKKFLKSEEVNAYKPHRTDEEQGGLGGVGVENWILQNGGSFTQAVRTFLDAAIDKTTGEMLPFNEFKKKYQIWDFGENHFAARKNNYLYDNFIENNMNETGYKKMVEGFKKYLKSLEETNDYSNESNFVI